MKLYASVTSERATKGQGGNERLDIQITVGSVSEPHEAGVIAVREVEPGVFNIGHFYRGEGRKIITIDTNEKGEKQKGECAHECEWRMQFPFGPSKMQYCINCQATR